MSCYFRVLRKWDAESSGLSNALDLIDSVKSFGFNSSKLPLDSALPSYAICHAYSSGNFCLQLNQVLTDHLILHQKKKYHLIEVVGGEFVRRAVVSTVIEKYNLRVMGLNKNH